MNSLRWPSGTQRVLTVSYQRRRVSCNPEVDLYSYGALSYIVMAGIVVEDMSED